VPDDADEPDLRVASELAFRRILEPDRDPAEVVPDATPGEMLLAAQMAENVARDAVEMFTNAGVLGRPRTPLDLTPRELAALAAIYQQVEPWLRKVDERPLSDVLKVVPPRVAENIAFMLNWAGWFDMPNARFRLEDDCDDA
jgi:hypothetical protein